MWLLRRQKLILCWLVIAALCGSSIAKVFCRTTVAPPGLTWNLADASVICSVNAAAGKARTDSPARNGAANCNVCLAFASAVPVPSAPLLPDKAPTQAISAVHRADEQRIASVLELGGLGSRAPPAVG